jgi:hypothetical protein
MDSDNFAGSPFDYVVKLNFIGLPNRAFARAQAALRLRSSDNTLSSRASFSWIALRS